MIDFVNLPFGMHLVVGTIVRLFLVLYSQFHDQTYEVPYTDVDYKVFTDASSYVINGDSPYRRHTYRYSPLLAIILTPNVLFNANFGKILFSLVDIVIGVAIRKLVKTNKCFDSNRIASHSALFWIYNPLAVVIATRGNADTLASFLVILSLLFLQTDIVCGLKKFFISGVFLGIAAHLRIYPLVFSFPMFISLGEYKIHRKTKILSDLYRLAIPNRKQWLLVFGCVSTLKFLTTIFFRLYGYEFLFETYIYHFLRKDIRHNFSLFFYIQYLTADDKAQYWYKAVPFFLLVTYFGLRYGRKNTLSFALLTQSIVLVVYNSVVTSQYFIWFLSLLPLCIADIKISKKKAALLFLIWLLSQAIWLYFGYQLEFEGKNVFFNLWCASIAFYVTNLYVLQELIRNYIPD